MEATDMAKVLFWPTGAPTEPGLRLTVCPSPPTATLDKSPCLTFFGRAAPPKTQPHACRSVRVDRTPMALAASHVYLVS